MTDPLRWTIGDGTVTSVCEMEDRSRPARFAGRCAGRLERKPAGYTFRAITA